MAFVIFCDQKGCGKENEPLLDVESDSVICSLCGKVIESVTSFTKVSMRSMGQIKRVNKVQIVFPVTCAHCTKIGQPKLVKNNLVCAFCTKIHEHLAGPYAHAIKVFLQTNSRPA